MDVRLSAEQRALRDAAAALVDAHGPRSVAQLDDPERRAKLAAAVAGAGWGELRAATEVGDPLASTVEVALVVEEFGRGLADAGILGPSFAADLGRRAGVAPGVAPRAGVLFAPDLSGAAVIDVDAPDSVSATGVGAAGAAADGVAVDGVGAAGAPADGVAVGGVGAAGAAADGVAVGGVAVGGVAVGGVAVGGVAVDARDCRSALALAPAANGYQLLAVPVATAEAGRDLTRPVAAMTGAAVEPLSGALSVEDLTRWQAFALALTCADLVGVMRGATELACGYAKIRHQYGVPIGSFQSVQHLLADAYVATEGSTSVARYAAWAADNLAAEEALTAAAVAKAYCARAARTVCESAIQVHGGIGNTWDCLAHVYLRRALFSIQLLGDAGVNLARVMSHHDIGGVRSGLR